MPRVLIARPARTWTRVPVTVALVAAQVLAGLLVVVLSTARVVLTLAVAAARYLEHQLATATGRPALSHTGIAAICAAFVHEFRTAYHQPTR